MISQATMQIALGANPLKIITRIDNTRKTHESVRMYIYVYLLVDNGIKWGCKKYIRRQGASLQLAKVYI